eukprot:1166647-Prymnesium_polylepis.1
MRVVYCGSEHSPNAPGNSCIPRIANTSISASTTPKTLATAGNDLTSETTINRMPGLRDTSRRGRSARRTRRGLSCGMPNSMTRDTSTMQKSRTFHGSLRYECSPFSTNPKETIFKVHSRVKMKVHSKSRLRSTMARSDAGSRRGESIARQIEETRITTMMRLSKRSSLTMRIALRRTQLSG